MKSLVILMALVLSSIAPAQAIANPASDETTVSMAIIPQPEHITPGKGAFTITAQTAIVAPAELDGNATYLIDLLAPATGYRLVIGSQAANTITLRLDPSQTDLGEEGYTLRVTAQGVVIEALKPAGIFYGIQSLRQLLPVQIDSPKPVSNIAWSVPCVQITDRPRFPWRGFMLDSCRHFQSVATVKRVIDLMSRQKLNRFHWHLTEDEAWRVEIPGYPELTAKGAWRAEPGNPHYGGFYTANDIREIVAYAKERFVIVYPELEMPGHATAALLAEPQLTCLGQPFEPGKPGLRSFYAVAGRQAFCPSRPETYTFLENVTTKISAMFDSPYFHIGADEVPHEHWDNCDRCRALIEKEHLKDAIGLQQYFERRMAAYVTGLGKHPIYWGLDNGREIPPGMIVQGWHSGHSLRAIRRGFQTINSDSNSTYLNYPSGKGDIGDGELPHLPIEKVYAFDPVPAEATPDQAKLVLGSEACLWTERVPEDKVSAELFPRLLAFAEIVWSPKQPRDFHDFQLRLTSHLQRLDLLGVPYFVPKAPVPAAARHEK